MRSPANEPFHRLVDCALRLHAAVQQGRPRDLAGEQARLINLLMAVPGEEEGSPGLGMRYAAVCWLDELFTCRSTWASKWNERKLESALYGSNDRATEFWRQAELAEARPTDETLAAYYLCVALGFRGRLENDPQAFQEWVDRTRSRVGRVDPPPAESRQGFVRVAPARPLHGASRLRRFSAMAAAAALLLLPVATYALIQKFAG